MNRIIRTVLFVSAFAPAVLVSVALQVIDRGLGPEMLAWFVAGLLACLLPFLVMAAVAQRAEQIPFSAKKIESQDWLLVVFVVSYFIPLITRVSDLSVFVPIFICAAIVLSSIDTIPCHPVLHLFRYRFYKVEGANGMVYTMITRRKILTADDVRKVRQISTHLLMEV
jgi:hypothetical protein